MNPKILFFSDLWFFIFGTSVFLQKKISADFYAIFDVDNKAREFFENQDLVNFKKKWFFLDCLSETPDKPDLEYLKSFESKYGINLWSIVYMDRFFYQFNPFYKFSKKEILSILESECRFFEKILDEIEPDFVTSYVTTMHYHELLRQLCEKKGIKVLNLNPSKIGFRMGIFKKPLIMDDLSSIKTVTTNKKISELQDYLKKYDPYQVALEYQKKNFMDNFWGRYKPFIKFLFSSDESIFSNRYYNYGKTKSKMLRFKFYNKIIKKYRQNFIEKNFIKSVESHIPFIYFPLHVEPERNLSIGSPFYSNQIEIIRNLAKSIPIGYKLLVKEHYNQGVIGWRDISYYRQLLNVPNVILVHPSVNPEVVLKNCSLVVSITGTAGMEALFYEKPVICFTENFYSHLPSVVKIDVIENLPQIVRQTLTKVASVEEVNRFVNEIEINTFPAHPIRMAADFSSRFSLKGLIMDSYLDIGEIKSFLQDYRQDFERMADEYIKKINSYE